MAGFGITASMIRALPKTFLDSTPLAQPPLGVRSNFANPETLRPLCLATSSPFLGLGTIFIFIRLYTKLRVLGTPTWDDITCFLGFVSTVVYYVAMVIGLTDGTAGIHDWDASLSRAITNVNLTTVYITAIFPGPSLGLIKCSLMIQYYSLFWPLRWARISIWVVGSSCAIFYTTMTVVAFILESPWPGEGLLDDILSNHFSIFLNFAIPIGVFGTVFDLFLLALPIKAVLSLQLHHKKKMVFLVIFATGVIASAASIAGLYFRIKTIKQFDYNEWYIAYVYMFNMIEAFGGVMCSSMPAVYRCLSSDRLQAIIFKSGLSSKLSHLFSKTSATTIDQADAVQIQTAQPRSKVTSGTLLASE